MSANQIKATQQMEEAQRLYQEQLLEQKQREQDDASDFVEVGMIPM